MNGKIYSACGTTCSCGGQFKTFNCKVTKISYPLCELCKNPPRELRVIKNMPDRKGNVLKKPFYSHKGMRLTDICACVELIGELNKDIHSEDFKLEHYSDKHRKDLLFETVAFKFINSYEQKIKLPENHEDHLSPKYVKELKGRFKVHLNPYFNGLSLDEITKFKIIEYHRTYINRFRTRDLCLGDLKALLNFSKDELDLLKEVPSFPKIKSAKQVRADDIPELDIQASIVRGITEKKYRDIWTLTCVLAKRPCEARAYKVKDLDLFNNTLKTQRHFSDGEKGDEILSGRKSLSQDEELGIVVDHLDEYLMELLTPYTIGKDVEDYLFKGDQEKFIDYGRMARRWNSSCKKLGVKVKPYTGSKHSTLTALLESTGSYAKVIKFSNHTNERTLKRYAKIKSTKKNSLVDSARFAEGCV